MTAKNLHNITHSVAIERTFLTKCIIWCLLYYNREKLSSSRDPCVLIHNEPRRKKTPVFPVAIH